MVDKIEDVVKDIVDDAIEEVKEDVTDEIKEEIEEVKEELEEKIDEALDKVDENETIEEDRIVQWMQQTSIDLETILESNKTILENQQLILQMLPKEKKLEEDPVDQDSTEITEASQLDLVPDQEAVTIKSRTIVV